MLAAQGGAGLTHRLLTAFENLFNGNIYRHRIPNQGDAVALELFEDLYPVSAARVSPLVSKYCGRVGNQQRVINPANVVMGSRGRRGDGTFGDPVPGTFKAPVPGYRVSRARTSTCEVGVEVKILCAAMSRQVGRVITDLKDQASYFQNHSPGKSPLKVAIVGVNHAPIYCSYEGQFTCAHCGQTSDVTTTTTGTGTRKHPIQQAASTIATIRAAIQPLYDRLLILEFSATNMAPFAFAWQNQPQVIQQYDALLTWLAAEYENRF